MNIFDSLLNIFDEKNTTPILFHAPAQARKGFIYGHSKKKFMNIYGFIDGHF